MSLDHRLCPVLAIANQKGGVGKTTTAINLAQALALQDLRVLLESRQEAAPPRKPRAHRLWLGAGGAVTDSGCIVELGYAVDRNHCLGADFELVLGASDSKANGDIQESSHGLGVQMGIATRFWRRDESRYYLPWMEVGFLNRIIRVSEFMRKPVAGTSGTQGVTHGDFQLGIGARARAIPLVLQSGSRQLWLGAEVEFAPIRLAFEPSGSYGGLNSTGFIGVQFGLSI